jgi:hypothetical protein
VVIQFHRILLRLNTTPSARAKDASRRFLDRAAFPSSERRGKFATPPLGNSLFSRDYILTADSLLTELLSQNDRFQGSKPALVSNKKSTWKPSELQQLAKNDFVRARI